MSEPVAGARHGRRARRAAVDETAPLAVVTDPSDPTGVPTIRGAVAAPGADTPMPRLRKFGKRARIIELVDPDDVPIVVPSAQPEEPQRSEPPAGREQPTQSEPITEREPSADPARGASGDVLTSQAGTSTWVVRTAADSEPTRDEPASATASAKAQVDPVAPAPESASAPAPTATSAPSSDSVPSAPAAAPAPGPDASGIRRDADGVELGELSVTEAPDPRPAPRFEGKVLHRPESGGGRGAVILVWVLIALGVIALVALLLTGVLGPAQAYAAVYDAVPSMLEGSAEVLTLPLDL